MLALIAGLWLYLDGLERSRQLELAERVRQEAALVNQKAEVAAAAVKAKLEAEVKQKAEAKQKADAEAAAAKARLDAEYLARRSTLMDLSIIARTAGTALSRRCVRH